MRAISISLLLIMLVASCGGHRERAKGSASHVTEATASSNEAIPAEAEASVPSDEAGAAVNKTLPADAVLIARDIVTDVIIRPDPDGDPWETEKVEGYKGDEFVNGIFSRIYDGTLTVYDYHSGEALEASDVRKLEKEFDNDRSKIGKLSFREDWYYSPSSNSLQKMTKSVTLGYELYNNFGKVYAYRAAFRADLNE